MNNIPLRIRISLVVGLLVLVSALNQWLNNELHGTVEQHKIVPAPLAEKVVTPDNDNYDIHSDYPSLPSGKDLRKENFEVEKKPERQLDTKIIYEMPSIERYLLQ